MYQKNIEFEIPKKDAAGQLVVDAEGKIVVEKHSAVLKRLSYGEKVDLEEESVEIKMTGNNPVTKINTGKMRVLSIIKSVVSSTIPLNTYEAVRSLPQEAGETLFQAYVELNSQNPNLDA